MRISGLDLQAPVVVIVLVDEPIARDRRVLASMDDYPEAQVIDCTMEATAVKIFRLQDCFRILLLVLRAIWNGRRLWSSLDKRFRVRNQYWIAGLRISIRNCLRALAVAERLRHRLPDVRKIHAHDLFCGIVGAELCRMTGATLIYDAHEVEFHRNRKNSWLRTAFDATVENDVIRKACEIRVVNVPIAALYEQIHGISPEQICVVPNDHFGRQSFDQILADRPSNEPALVYVGAGVRGRQLDRLAAEASLLGIPVYSFFVGQVPEIATAGNWILGSADYEEELSSLVASRRCAMWCCVDDTCLSYRLALPNKFFQALAVGIPVVASAGTYLADLVTTYNIGFIFDGSNFQIIVQEMREDDFFDKQNSIRRFQKGLTAGSVRI